MANIVFNKILTEDNNFLSTEILSSFLLENQDNVSVLIDYTHVAFVEQSPRIIYITKGN